MILIRPTFSRFVFRSLRSLPCPLGLSCRCISPRPWRESLGLRRAVPPRRLPWKSSKTTGSQNIENRQIGLQGILPCTLYTLEHFPFSAILAYFYKQGYGIVWTRHFVFRWQISSVVVIHPPPTHITCHGKLFSTNDLSIVYIQTGLIFVIISGILNIGQLRFF